MEFLDHKAIMNADSYYTTLQHTYIDMWRKCPGWLTEKVIIQSALTFFMNIILICYCHSQVQVY